MTGCVCAQRTMHAPTPRMLKKLNIIGVTLIRYSFTQKEGKTNRAKTKKNVNTLQYCISLLFFMTAHKKAYLTMKQCLQDANVYNMHKC